MIPSSRLTKFLKQGFSVAFITASICTANLYAGPTGDAAPAKENAASPEEDSAAATTLSDIAEREMVRRLQRVKDEFSLKKCVAAYEQCYEELTLCVE